MAIKTHTCITITCDDCGETAPIDEDMGEAHYPSIEEARKDLAYLGPDGAWDIADDGTVSCHQCRAKKVCADAGGHQWSEWATYGSSRYATRHCQRSSFCGGYESRPIKTAGGV